MKTPTWKVVMFPAGRRFDHMGAVFKTLTVEAHTGMAAEEEALAMWGPKWQICSVKRLTGYSNIPVEARNNDTPRRLLCTRH